MEKPETKGGPMIWTGELTTDNVDEVAELLRKLLVGKIFTIVEVNECFDFTPKAQRNQKLDQENPIKVDKKLGHGYTSVIINTPDCAFILLTNVRRDSCSPPENPRLTFSSDSVSIRHLSDEGRRLQWLILVESDIPEILKK